MKTNYPRLKKKNDVSRAATTCFQQVRGNKSNGFCYWYLKLKRFTHSYPLERDWFQDSVACMCTQCTKYGSPRVLWSSCINSATLKPTWVQLLSNCTSKAHKVTSLIKHHCWSEQAWCRLHSFDTVWCVTSPLLVLLINPVSHTWVLSHYKQH